MNGKFRFLVVAVLCGGLIAPILVSNLAVAQNQTAAEDPGKNRDFTTGIGWHQDNNLYKPASAHEGQIEAFLKPAAFETQSLFAKDRFPTLVIAMDGTVIAAWNNGLIRRSSDGGTTWDEPLTIAEGFMGGGYLVDEISGDVLAFIEDGHPPTKLRIYRSKDHGLTWNQQETVLFPNSFGHIPHMHMNEHGITLRHGQYKGRLVRASRWYGRSNYPVENFHTHYTNAIFSDDGGLTWKASEPFPVMGTGEACIVELSNGTLHYNTRRHWAPEAEDALWRWTGESEDGGQTWQNPIRSAVLPDGDPATTYGLMGGLVRLPVLGRDVLIYSNIVSPKGRRNGHVWASFDGGKTWPVRRQVFDGTFAYSSLNAGRKGTPSEGWIYLLYEGGRQGAGTVCRFNLSWILTGGELTGDGELSDWLEK
ncbi:MAG: exo-alpha-sialidase [Pirellulaceae bacterium]|nr:exo-alpha-sialidase [Pirellulaceae bacterium]